MSVVYIAGPISGTADYKERFSNAENQLKDAGYTVLSPTSLPDDLPYESYFPICFAMIDVSERLYFLKGWEKSHGARMEFTHAMKKSKAVMFEGEG